MRYMYTVLCIINTILEITITQDALLIERGGREGDWMGPSSDKGQA